MVSKLTKLSAATLIALGASGAAMADDDRYIIQVDAAKKGVVKALAKKLGAEFKTEGQGFFSAEFSGMDLAQVKGLMNNPHVKAVEADVRRYPMALYNDDAGDATVQQLTPYAVYQSQADQLTLQPGMKVCIIDSGIAGSQGETGGKNYDFDWSVITGDNDSGTGNWNADGGPHGTHVAGTIAAADNGFGVVGMAPGVPLHIIKVFNNSGWGYSSDLAVAAQKCTNAGANIISMSLGGGGANSTEENAFNTFTNNGGLVVAAAGNDGNNVRSYPAGYKSVMMIGANDANNNIADFSQFPSNTKSSGRGKNATTETHDGYGVEVTAGGVDTLSTYPSGGASMASMTAGGAGFAASAMENNGEASGSTYFMGTAEATDNGANGKICVIDRGNISFHDKVQNCENSGGLGAIVINNEAGMLYGTLGDTNATTIPAVGAALEDRAAIVAANSATVKVGASDYGYMSGTSMATPAASGMAALIWSNHPNCTGTDIREAMKATAEDQGTAGRDDYFGYGIVKAKAASDYLATQACGGGNPPTGNIAPVASFNFSCTDLSCSFDGSASSDSDGNIVSYSWSFGASTATANHTFAASGDYTVSLTVTDNEGATHTSTKTVSVSDGSEPPAADITLSGSRSGNGRSITLNWNGATGANVDVYVNGSLNGTTANDGSVSYSVNKRNTYTFTICEEGSTTACSNTITL
ncbi:S8 family serine peptidase [Aliikangiella sp. G2MR2-5]|uniref:S8 family serine peptidase n=1 Tax=Aliikangiella sp. G2MR2-5 TaxID=2788943 RepID=UPI00352D2897